MPLTEEAIAAECENRSVFGSGANAFQSGSVTDFDQYHSAKYQQIILSASVKGGGVYYNVEAALEEGSETIAYYDCDCAGFSHSKGACPHIAAVLLRYLNSRGPVAAPDTPCAPLQTDFYTAALLRRCQQAAQPAGAQNAALSCAAYPTLLLPAQGQPPELGLSLGRDRRYIIRDFSKLSSDFAAGATVAYGKRLTLTHRWEVFDPLSQQLLRLVIAKQEELSRAASFPLSAETAKRSLRLTPNALDRLFSLYRGRRLEVKTESLSPSAPSLSVFLKEEDPALTLAVERQEHRAGFLLRLEEKPRCLKGEERIYLLVGDQLYCCSAAYAQELGDFLWTVEQAGGQLALAEQDLPLFCSTLLPRLEQLLSLSGEEEALKAFSPDRFVLQLYLAMPSPEIVTAEPKCRYGNQEVSLLDPTPREGIRRDALKEQQLLELCRSYFPFSHSDGRRLYLEGPDRLFALLQEGIPALAKTGEVFVSKRLKEQKVLPPPKMSVGVALKSGLLDLTIEAGGLSLGELAGALGAYRQSQRYYRLKDGQFLSLEGPGLRDMAALADGLMLSRKELEKGRFAVPKFRALYLDGLLSSSEGLVYTRDEYFAQLAGRLGQLSEQEFPVPAPLDGVLRDYQKTGYRWLRAMEQLGFGGVLADDMGLGKTLQTITLFFHHQLCCHPDALPQGEKPVPKELAGLPSLVVCPASLVLNWQSEIARFAPSLQTLAVLGDTAARAKLLEQSHQYDLVVTSYDLLKRDEALYQGKRFYYMVLDEAQYIKNSNTRNAQAVKSIDCVQRFALTGTPIENRLSELWSIFDFLMPQYLFQYAQFRAQFEIPAMKEEDSGALERLRRMVSPFLLRRLKKDVLRELPPKTETIRKVPLSGEQHTLYQANLSLARSQLEEELRLSGAVEGDLLPKGRMRILALLTRLRQLCCDPALCYEDYAGPSAKLDSCMELVAESVEGGHKVLLFSQFTSMLTRIEQKLSEMGLEYFLLRGSTSKEKRAELVARFNRDDTPVFLVSLKAGGTGLNLTGADVVIHYDPWWNLAAQNQATDRAHRIGQKNPVQVYKLIAQNTIEEKILALQQRKRGLSDAVVEQGGEGNLFSLSREELLELMSQ